MADEKKVQKQEETGILEFNEKQLEKLSHRQLRSTLRKVSNRNWGSDKRSKINGVEFNDPKRPDRAGLSNLWATVLAVVVENTRTVGVKRKDQIGPGKLNSYPL